MPSPQDMCLLQDVKAWIYANPTDNKWPTGADALIARNITSASRAILSSLQRGTLLYNAVNELRSGVGGNSLVLRRYPLISLSQLVVDGLPVLQRPPAGTPGPAAPGWVIANPWDGFGPGEPAQLFTDGSCFTRGNANVTINYYAGYATFGEAASVPPVSGPYTVVPQQPNGPWAQDIGVTYASGTPMTPVATTAALTTGTYLPPQPATAPVLNTAWAPTYTFAVGDASASILLSYSYTPADLNYVAMKWVGEWMKYKDRIGARSRSLPGGAGTETWDLSAMPADIVAIMQPYRRVIPN